jgi:hypothetical protein
MPTLPLETMILHYAFVAATVYAICSLALSRCVVFMGAYQEALSTQRRESWLFDQCQNATFYANMRHHTNVCEAVQRNAERSPTLFALDAVSVIPLGAPSTLVMCAGAAAVAVQAVWYVALFIYKNRRRIFRGRDVFV